MNILNWNILKKAWEYLSILPTKALAVLVVATPVLFIVGYIGYTGIKSVTDKLNELSLKIESVNSTNNDSIINDLKKTFIIYIDNNNAILAGRDSMLEVKIVNKLNFILKNQKRLAKEGIEEYMKDWKDGIFIYKQHTSILPITGNGITIEHIKK